LGEFQQPQNKFEQLGTTSFKFVWNYKYFHKLDRFG